MLEWEVGLTKCRNFYGTFLSIGASAMAAHSEKGSPIHILPKSFNSERLSQNTAFVVSEYRPRGGGISDHWDDNFNQEKAPPDFLVEREDVVGEGALADQLAKLADLYISKLQGNRMAGLADLGEDLLKLAETGIHDGSSSCAGLMKELCRRTG